MYIYNLFNHLKGCNSSNRIQSTFRKRFETNFGKFFNIFSKGINDVLK